MATRRCRNSSTVCPEIAYKILIRDFYLQCTKIRNFSAARSTAVSSRPTQPSGRHAHPKRERGNTRKIFRSLRSRSLASLAQPSLRSGRVMLARCARSPLAALGNDSYSGMHPQHVNSHSECIPMEIYVLMLVRCCRIKCNMHAQQFDDLLCSLLCCCVNNPIITPINSQSIITVSIILLPQSSLLLSFHYNITQHYPSLLLLHCLLDHCTILVLTQCRSQALHHKMPPPRPSHPNPDLNPSHPHPQLVQERLTPT